jgi:hypothetical protein
MHRSRKSFVAAALSLNAKSRLRFSDFPWISWIKSFLWGRDSQHVFYCHMDKSSQRERRIAYRLEFLDRKNLGFLGFPWRTAQNPNWFPCRQVSFLLAQPVL